MAYPPVVPANTIANGTSQFDTHPAHHNGLANAITDIIAELGAAPKGTYASVNARLDQGPARLLLTRATGQSIDNAGLGEQIDWDTAESYVSAVGSSFKAAADKAITIPAGLGGDYLVSLSGQFDTNATGVRQLQVVIGSNATAAAAGELTNIFTTVPAHASIPGRLALSEVVRLDAGATLQAWAYQNSGAGLVLSNMRFSAVRIGS